MQWFNTSAGKCWGCDRLAADVNLMYVNDSNYRYCFDCRYDPRVHKRSDADDDDSFDPFEPFDRFEFDDLKPLGGW